MTHKHEEGDPGDKAHYAAQRISLLLYVYNGTTRVEAVKAAFKLVAEFTSVPLADCLAGEIEVAQGIDVTERLLAPEKPVGGLKEHHCPNCLTTTQCALVRCPRPYETVCADCETLGWYMDDGIVRYRGRN